MEKYNLDKKLVRQKTPDKFIKQDLAGKKLDIQAIENRTNSSTSFTKGISKVDPNNINPNSKSDVMTRQQNQPNRQSINTLAGHKSTEEFANRKSTEFSGTGYTDRLEENAEINKPLKIDISKNFNGKTGLPPQSPNISPYPPPMNKVAPGNLKTASNLRGPGERTSSP